MFLFLCTDVAIDTTKCDYVLPSGNICTCHMAHTGVYDYRVKHLFLGYKLS